MALKPPGTRSNLALLASAAWLFMQLVVLIGGHVVIGYWLLGLFGYVGTLAELAADYGAPVWALYLLAAGAIALDGWIGYHRYQDIQRRRAR
ncbi:MAG: hypothetical protein D6771_04990 [Zetaproteobacteria bacterium]|nr:MAG: hypothetical protein D6771_04990 [Zetaproteobacteria bacterium]